MISVSIRTLLLYNFGIALIFVVIGMLSAYSLEATKPARAQEPAAFSDKARKSVEEEQAIEVVRARALFYFDGIRDIRQARAQGDSRFYDDVRVLSLMVAGLFVLGGILAWLQLAPGDVQPKAAGKK